MDKKDLEKLHSMIVETRKELINGEQEFVADIDKSFMILENKTKHYLSIYDVLNRPDNDSVGDNKSENQIESKFISNPTLTND